VGGWHCARLPELAVSGCLSKGAITGKVKHAVKRKTTPARLTQLLQPHWHFVLACSQ